MSGPTKTELQEQREAWLSHIRPHWYRVMRPLGNWLPWELRDKMTLDDAPTEDYFRPAPVLSKLHLQHCVVVSERAVLLQDFLPKNGICCEVGTGNGKWAEQILRYSRPTKLHVIDISFADFKPEAFKSALAEGVVSLHEHDSVAALKQFPDAYFDWVYIDAQHTYEGVVRDIQAAKTKIKSDGMLVFNDYGFWSHRELMAYGVMQAVNEFCLSEGWEFICLALHPEGLHDVVIRKLKFSGVPTLLVS
jgi:hypothetical protein